MTTDQTPSVVLDSIDEIRALHRMLIERKFDGTEDEFFGSPFIAAVQHRLADALTTAEPSKPWAAWRDAAGHSEKIDKVRNHIAGLGRFWAEANVTTRRQCVRDLLAPLLPDDTLLHDLTA
ncbi:hypothetical protein EV385_3005 [Krasilnikovia cinnamomea]|uniref:Uncharacterized protein n=1 Tax=Krasilnikovia cinnamomea TaxID=349313 RepID=A0A4Q7ZJW5_9ACTN|nr:hypothetical protein [Krasilnikovia cinnamomea]RZU51198.1 hypothetical protein EV385_3005 [Krasilnikovia cinnamomea]